MRSFLMALQSKRSVSKPTKSTATWQTFEDPEILTLPLFHPFQNPDLNFIGSLSTLTDIIIYRRLGYFTYNIMNGIL